MSLGADEEDVRERSSKLIVPTEVMSMGGAHGEADTRGVAGRFFDAELRSLGRDPPVQPAPKTKRRLSRPMGRRAMTMGYVVHLLLGRAQPSSAAPRRTRHRPRQSSIHRQRQGIFRHQGGHVLA